MIQSKTKTLLTFKVENREPRMKDFMVFADNVKVSWFKTNNHLITAYKS